MTCPNGVQVPTTTPDEALGAVITYVREQQAAQTINAIGVATFGPVDLRPDSATYGHLTTTPKPGWAGADLLGPLREVFDGPIGLDTDVNGAALGELRWGAGQGLDSLVYVTVGTGVGGGAVIGGQPVHGLLHPEMGHLLPRRHPADDFAGHCPTHGDCLEGMVAGPAWLARWGKTSTEMDEPARQQAAEITGFYLAQMVVTLVLTLSPQRIVFGGGVMAEPLLLPEVRRQAVDLLDGYVAHPAITDRTDEYIVPPGLGDRAGVLGAVALAADA